jgi:Holliday junction resolvase RusA-like endonuclease
MTQEVFINKLPPSLNGKDGLIRMHWAKKSQLSKTWVWLIHAENMNPHLGRVQVEFTRVSTRKMDYDNIRASFKLVGDALVRCGIIQDDSPDFITELKVKWKKAKTLKEQGIMIKIEDVV